MAGSVKLLKLVKLLSLAENHSLSKEECLKHLCVTENEFESICSDLKSLGLGACVSDEKISIFHPYEPLDEDLLFRKSKGKGRVCVLPEIDSTNSEILRNIDSYTDGDVLLAEIQTAGRGRRGRKWSCSLGCQVLLSSAAFFDLSLELSALPLAVGLNVAWELEKAGFSGIKVKWPNDLYFENAKIAGILIESIVRHEDVGAVIGIGMNVFPFEDSSLDLQKRKILSLSDIDSRKAQRNFVAYTLISAIRQACFIYREEGFAPFREKWSSYDYLFNKRVLVNDDVNKISGICSGIDDNGALLVNADGTMHSVKAGHVEFL